MEKSYRGVGLSIVLGFLSLLLSLSTVWMCKTAHQSGAPSKDDALIVSGTASEELSGGRPSDEAMPVAPTESDESLDGAEKHASSVYTVRLIPNPDASPSLGVYDAANALVLKVSVPLATLCQDDQAALEAGISTDGFEAAQQLVRDFCE